MKLNWKRSLLISLLAVPLMAAIGCNSNPVTPYDTSDSPISTSFNPGITTKPKLDILWVIDNSGSMAEEQAALLDAMGDLADALAKANVDANIAITTTSWPYAALVADTDLKNIKAGKFVEQPQAWAAKQNLLGYGGRADAKMKKSDFIKYYDAAWACSSVTPTKTGEQVYNELIKKAVDERGTGYFPSKSDYASKNILTLKSKPFLSTEDFLNPADQKLNSKDFTTYLKCLSLVGLRGNSMESGLTAAIKAVDKEGPNKKYLSQFLRKDAPLMLIIVSDENDCSRKEGVDDEKFNPTGCDAHLCEFFNLEGFAEHFPGYDNPLLPPLDAAKIFIDNVKSVKGSNFSEKDLHVFSVTGPDLPELAKAVALPPLYDNPEKTLPNFVFDFTWPSVELTSKHLQDVAKMAGKPAKDGYCIDKNKTWVLGQIIPEIVKTTGTRYRYSCNTAAFGSATSGNRYIKFLDGFQNRFPTKSAIDESKKNTPPYTTDFIKASGLLCLGNYNDVTKQITNIINSLSNRCVPPKSLSGCDNGEAVGDSCGSEADRSTCALIPNSKPAENFCPAYMQVLLKIEGITSNKDTIIKNYCKTDSLNTVAGFEGYCILDTAKYKWKACPANVAGVQFEFENTPQALKDLKDVEVQIRYTSLKSQDK